MVVEAAPVGGDSVEIRMRRAHDADVRAREAEDQALAAAQESKARSAHARKVSEHGRARLQIADGEPSDRSNNESPQGLLAGGGAKPVAASA